MSYDKSFKLQRAPHLISILIHDSDFLKFNHYPMTSLNTKNDLNLPTYTDIEHYKLFRQAGQKLCDELAKKFLSKSVLKECGKKLGIFKNNMMVFDSEDAMSVLFDYCLHQFYVNKLSIAERYLRISPPDSNSIEYEILQSMLKAHYSIFIAKEVFENKGVLFLDVLHNKKVFVIDLGLSKTAEPGVVFAGHLLPLKTFYATSGGWLPIPTKQLLDEQIIPTIDKFLNGQFGSLSKAYEASFSAQIIRILLKSNVWDNFGYGNS